MVSLEYLEILSVFRRCGTLTSAAKELHMTQSTLTRDMQKLEAQLGMDLFERRRNRLTLNRCGEIAANYADRLLLAEAEMRQVLMQTRREQTTIFIGSASQGPAMLFVPALTRAFPEMAVSSEVRVDEYLLEKLHLGHCQLILTSYDPTDSEFFAVPYCTEQLYLSLPAGVKNPAKESGEKRKEKEKEAAENGNEQEELLFSDIANMQILMPTGIGVWEGIVRRHMPSACFVSYPEQELRQEIRKSSLAAFDTDIGMQVLRRAPDRQYIPFADPAATQRFYCVCRRDALYRFRDFLDGLSHGNS